MPPAAPPADAPSLLGELAAARLLSGAQARQVSAQFADAGLQPTADGLAEFLVLAGLLTPHQADRARAGQATRLVLGPYLLQEPVGSGSLGTVYRALHRDTRGRFAVKVLPLRSMWNVLQAKGQLREFAALAANPAVVPFVDIDTAAGAHYLVWPFVKGETLDRLVERVGPLPPGDAVTLLAEVADGLAACHARGVVHGLLKPSNVLVGPDRRAKMLDLGIGAILAANLAEDESLMDTISTASTASAMIDCAAPETLADPTDRTPAGDLYSLGCVLFYLLSGRYPFPDGNMVDKMIAHQSQEPPSLSQLNKAVPGSLAELAAWLLRKSPGDRPRSAAVARDALLAAVPATASAALLDAPGRTVSTTPAPWPSHSGGLDFETPAARATDTPSAEDSISFEVTHSLLARDMPWSAPASLSASDKPKSRAIRVADARPTVAVPALPATASAGLLGEPGTTLSLGPALPTPPRGPGAWRRAWRRALFWLPPADAVQLSLFGPPRLVPGRTHRFQVYTHPPETFASVRTLSRAFQPDTELRGAGYLPDPVPRGDEIGLHLSLPGTGVAQPLVRFAWAGQTRPYAFEVYVPWESLPGPADGVLTVGLNDREAATVRFAVVLVPRGS